MAKIIEIFKTIGTIAGVLTGPTVGSILIYIGKMNPIGALICMTLTVWGAAFALYLWRILPMEKKLEPNHDDLTPNEKKVNFYDIVDKKLAAFEKNIKDREQLSELLVTRQDYNKSKVPEYTVFADLSLMERVNRIERLLSDNDLKTESERKK